MLLICTCVSQTVVPWSTQVRTQLMQNARVYPLSLYFCFLELRHFIMAKQVRRRGASMPPPRGASSSPCICGRVCVCVCVQRSVAEVLCKLFSIVVYTVFGLIAFSVITWLPAFLLDVALYEWAPASPHLERSLDVAVNVVFLLLVIRATIWWGQLRNNPVSHHGDAATGSRASLLHHGDRSPTGYGTGATAARLPHGDIVSMSSAASSTNLDDGDAQDPAPGRHLPRPGGHRPPRGGRRSRASGGGGSGSGAGAVAGAGAGAGAGSRASASDDGSFPYGSYDSRAFVAPLSPPRRTRSTQRGVPGGVPVSPYRSRDRIASSNARRVPSTSRQHRPR